MSTVRITLDEMRTRLEAGSPAAADAGFLGVDLEPAAAALVLLPVPWEPTVSYGGGTCMAPEAITKASHQLDLEDRCFDRPYRAGIACLEANPQISALNQQARAAAQKVRAALGRGDEAERELDLVNAASAKLDEIVYRTAVQQLENGKLVGVIGGDHSSPYGLIRALSEAAEPFAILHFDAHHDLRCAYEGFTRSHASIFYNTMEEIPMISKLVPVAIRDFSREERRYVQQLGDRCKPFYVADLFRMKAEGVAFAAIAQQILATLPERVYISFDIDALDPPYCPSTGTPVPGGLTFSEACYIIERLALSRHRIIGFDLCEVAPAANGNGNGNEWDANVGARLLYKLCGALLHSNNLCQRSCS